MAPGHHDVGRRERRRGHRRSAVADDQLVLEDGRRREPRAAGSRSSTSTPWSTATCCSSYRSGPWRGLQLQAAARARRRAGVVRAVPARRRRPSAGCSPAWSTTSSGCDVDRRHLRLPLRAAGAVRLRRRRRARASSRCATPSSPWTGAADPPHLVAGEYGRGRDDPAAGPLPARPGDLSPRRARGRHVATGLARRLRARPHAGGRDRARHLLRHREPRALPARQDVRRRARLVPQRPPGPAGRARGHHLLALDRHALVAHGVPRPPLRLRDEARAVRRETAPPPDPEPGG